MFLFKYSEKYLFNLQYCSKLGILHYAEIFHIPSTLLKCIFHSVVDFLLPPPHPPSLLSVTKFLIWICCHLFNLSFFGYTVFSLPAYSNSPPSILGRLPSYLICFLHFWLLLTLLFIYYIILI